MIIPASVINNLSPQLEVGVVEICTTLHWAKAIQLLEQNWSNDLDGINNLYGHFPKSMAYLFIYNLR